MPRPALLVLRLAVALSCAGIAWTALEFGDAVLTTLFVDWRWAEDVATACSRGGALVLVAGAAGALAGVAAPLWAAGTWCLLLAAAATLQAAWQPWLVPGEHAVRFAAPVALAWVLRGAPDRARAAELALRVAAAATFAAHGVKALLGHGRFVDLILRADERLLGAGLTQADAEAALLAIGWVDIALAVGVLATRWRWVPLYMAAWGLLTAASRIVHSGEDAIPAFLLRAVNWGVPLALAFAFGAGARDRLSSPADR